MTISRLVNAFFRWVQLREPRRGRRGAIDYANACPDVALTSLRYYFPWAMTALVRWTVFTLVAGRKPGPRHGRLLRDRRPRRPVVRRQVGGLPPARRRVLRDRALPRLLREPTASQLDEVVLDWVDSPDTLLVETVRATYPAAEHDRFVAHFRGLVGLWVTDAKAVLPGRRRSAGVDRLREGWPSRRCPSRTSRSPDARRASPPGGASSPDRHHRSAPRCRLRRRRP